MTNRWRVIVSCCVILVEILALLLIIVGLYQGSPVHIIDLLLGGFLAIGGLITIVFVSRQKAK